MIYLVLIAISLMLFGGFLLLTAFERGRGMRVAGVPRNRLDAHVARISFVITHVDWPAFVRHLIGSTFSRAAHDITHTVLILVRSLERLLTHAVKSLRERREHPQAHANASGVFDRTMARVRQALLHARRARTRPPLTRKRVIEEGKGTDE